MQTLALSKLAILLILLSGVTISLVWFLFRPSFYKRGLEKASQSGSGRLPRYLKWGLVATGFATLAVAFLSVTLTYREAEETKVRSDRRYEQVNEAVTGKNAGPAHHLEGFPVYFESTYVKFQKTSPRIWIQTADHNWLETYKSQTSNVFSYVSLTTYKGCTGGLLRKRGEESFEVFLPSSDCDQVLMFRVNSGAWQELGPMSNISQTISAIK